MSGFKKCSPGKGCLNPAKWTRIAHEQIGPAINFKFAPYRFRNFIIPGGQFFASHAEVKLAVWYCVQLMRHLNLNWNSQKSLTRCLLELNKRPLGLAQTAIIENTKPPCKECQKFLNQLTLYTGIRFKVEYRRCMALVPETETPRAYALAHESDAQDDEDFKEYLNDFPNILDDDDLEPEIQDFDCEEIQTGLELVDINTLTFRQRRDGNPWPDAPENNESDYDFQESYRDDQIDASYRGVSSRRHHLPTSLDVNMVDRGEEEDALHSPRSEGTGSATITDGSQHSPIPTPKSLAGHESNPVNVPSSPSEQVHPKDNRSRLGYKNDKRFEEKIRQATWRKVKKEATDDIAGPTHQNTILAYKERGYVNRTGSSYRREVSLPDSVRASQAQDPSRDLPMVTSRDSAPPPPLDARPSSNHPLSASPPSPIIPDITPSALRSTMAKIHEYAYQPAARPVMPRQFGGRRRRCSTPNSEDESM